MNFKSLVLLCVLFSCAALADSPPPGTVKIKGADGTVIGNVGDSMKVIPSLPTNASIETGGHLDSIDTKLTTLTTALGSPFQAGGSIGNTSFGISGNLPAFASTPTFNLGTLNGAATEATLSSLLTALGSPLQAGGSIGNTAFGISGTLPAFAVTPTFNLGTLNGAATEATLSTLNGKVTAVDTGNVTVSSSALPSGAATEATLSQIVTNTAGTGKQSIAIARNDYSSVNVTTGAYVQLIASTSDDINYMDVFDSSGRTLVFAVGGSGSEVDQFNIVPGGNGAVPLRIPAGSRISVKAVSATANAGELDINFYK